MRGVRSVLSIAIAVAAASCGVEPGQDPTESSRAALTATNSPTYLYFRCSATGWGVDARTRLVPGASPGLWTLTYDVSQPWMTTGWDSCTLTETNRLDGWGTWQRFYDKVGAQLLVVPMTTPAGGQVAAAVPGQNYHFDVQYAATGNHRVTVDWRTKAFWIERVDTPAPAAWVWPVPGQDGKDWVINNYVDLDPTPAIRDYRGGSKAYDGHAGVDIDISSFRDMDQGKPVVAVSAGTVVGFVDTNADRHVFCEGEWNYVAMTTDDGYSVIYGHLKQGSVSVNVGDRVAGGATLAMVGSSGCSSWPHLHLEAYGPDGALVDPFRDGLWASAPVYAPPLSVMDIMVADHPIESTDYIADPAPNVTSVQRDGWLAVGISAAGGTTGDVLGIVVTQTDGAVYQSADIAMPEAARHTIWFYNWIVDGSAPTGTWTVQILVNGAVTRTHQVQVN